MTALRLLERTLILGCFRCRRGIYRRPEQGQALPQDTSLFGRKCRSLTSGRMQIGKRKSIYRQTIGKRFVLGHTGKSTACSPSKTSKARLGSQFSAICQGGFIFGIACQSPASARKGPRRADGKSAKPGTSRFWTGRRGEVRQGNAVFSQTTPVSRKSCTQCRFGTGGGRCCSGGQSTGWRSTFCRSR